MFASGLNCFEVKLYNFFTLIPKNSLNSTIDASWL